MTEKLSPTIDYRKITLAFLADLVPPVDGLTDEENAELTKARKKKGRKS